MCLVHVSIISFVAVYELYPHVVLVLVVGAPVTTAAVVVNSYELMVFCLPSCCLFFIVFRFHYYFRIIMITLLPAPYNQINCIPRIPIFTAPDINYVSFCFSFE